MDLLRINRRKGIFFYASLILLVSPNLLDFSLNHSNFLLGISTVSLSLCLLLIPIYFLPHSVAVALLLILVFIGAIEVFFVYNYGSMLSTGAIASIIGTNYREGLEVIEGHLVQVVIYLCVVFLIVYLFNVPRITKSRHFFTEIATIFALFFTSQLALSLNIVFSGGQDDDLASKKFIEQNKMLIKSTFPTSFLVKFSMYIDQKNKLEKMVSNKALHRFGAAQLPALEGISETYVIVIGESSRKKNWSLYGYERNTTPLLSSVEGLVVYTDYISTSSITRISIPLMMTRATPMDYEISYKEKSLISAFREAGFKTFWISNQEQYGNNDTVSSAIGFEANTQIFIPESGTMPKLDQSLIEPFIKVLSTKDKKKLIVLHTMGSHFGYSRRYNEQFDVFTSKISRPDFNKEQNRFIGEYDNSILYTDSFVNEIIEVLANEQQQSALVYVSDHGEILFDNGHRNKGHGFSHVSRLELETPLLFWFSEQFKAQNQEKYRQVENNKNKPVSADVFFHSIADMAAITFPGHVSGQSVFAKKLQINPRNVRTPEGDTLNYQKLP